MNTWRVYSVQEVVGMLTFSSLLEVQTERGGRKANASGPGAAANGWFPGLGPFAGPTTLLQAGACAHIQVRLTTVAVSRSWASVLAPSPIGAEAALA